MITQQQRGAQRDSKLFEYGDATIWVQENCCVHEHESCHVQTARFYHPLQFGATKTAQDIFHNRCQKHERNQQLSNFTTQGMTDQGTDLGHWFTHCKMYESSRNMRLTVINKHAIGQSWMVEPRWLCMVDQEHNVHDQQCENSAQDHKLDNHAQMKSDCHHMKLESDAQPRAGAKCCLLPASSDHILFVYTHLKWRRRKEVWGTILAIRRLHAHCQSQNISRVNVSCQLLSRLKEMQE